MSFFDNAKAITFAGKAVKKLELAGKVIWEAISFKNWVPYSIDTDGSIYNGGLGYKDGYRIRSGGAEGTSSNGSCTGFIPCGVGDTLRVADPSGASLNNNNTETAINFYNASKTHLGQLVGNATGYGTCAGMGKLPNVVTIHSNNMWEYTVPASIGEVAYVRITVYRANLPNKTAKNLIVTVNQEIPQ